MTRLQVRTDPGQAIEDDVEFLLDWFQDTSKSTVQYGADFLKGLSPSPVARDLLRVGGAVYCADKLVRRDETDDFWTREIDLQVPVSDVALWRRASPLLDKTLGFLAGEEWHVTFVRDTLEKKVDESPVQPDEVVSLFSGGLDSLVGVIDLLEQGKRLVLVGHHDSPLTDHKQVELSNALRVHYGEGRLGLRRLLLRPNAPSSAQARPLPDHDPENTTRARSFLFIAAGVAVADALGADVPLYVPENGFIGINVPLTAARAGSLSTRTTHPLYMARMGALLDQVGLSHPVENPYRLLTKGEALERCANERLVRRLAPVSISCSHPEHARLRHRRQGNCGYCYPCLIRRAALHRIQEDRSDDYSWNALRDANFLRRAWDSGRSLRALVTSLGQPERRTDVLRNGRIPNGETGLFFEVYRRGRAELRVWLTSGAAEPLRLRLKQAS